MTQKAEAVQTAIDALAAKLAVPAEKLWGVLVRQAAIEAWSNFAWLLITPLLWYAWLRVYRWIKAKEERWDVGSDMFGIVGAIALTLLSLAVLIACTGSVGYLINPDYYAVKEILGALK